MNPPCIMVVDSFIPAVRREIARILVLERGYPQSRAAELLGITQAMVSKYVTSEGKMLSYDIQNKINSLSRELVEVLETPGEATRTLCSYCISIREAGMLCDVHRKYGADEACFACMNLGRENNPRNAVLHNLDKAVDMLVGKNIALLIPQVRSNIAMSTKNPSGPGDVASIPGRLILVRGKVCSPTAPEYNASHHTTQLLLRLNEKDRSIQSLINIVYSSEVALACEQAGYKLVEAPRTNGRIAIEDITPHFDGVIDKGDFGIEPCIYLVGSDAIEVAKKAIKISELLKPFKQ